jgi:N utilization substance protein B
MLFQVELGRFDADQVIPDFWRHFEADPEGRSYADAVVRGVAARRAEIDDLIAKASVNWRLERMTAVDRNVLRVGTYELLVEVGTPRAVILDEAVELAKQFGAENSGPFVNGVLDRIAVTLNRVDRDRQP